MLFRNWALNDYNKSGCVVINKDVFCWFMFIKVYTLPSVRISLFSMAFLYTDNRFPHASKISLNFLLNSGNYHLCTNFLQYMSKFFFYIIFFIATGGLDEPIHRPYIQRDWRFGHYEMEGLHDPLSRFSRYILSPFSLGRKRKPQRDDNDDLVLEPLELSFWLLIHTLLKIFPLKLGCSIFRPQ